MGNRSGRGLGSHGAQNGEASLNQLVVLGSVELETEISAIKEKGRMLQGPRVRKPPRSRPPGWRCSERSPASSLHGMQALWRCPSCSLCSFCPFLFGIAHSTAGTTRAAKGSRTWDQRTMSSFTGENRLFMLVSSPLYLLWRPGSVPPWAAELLPQKPACLPVHTE